MRKSFSRVIKFLFLSLTLAGGIAVPSASRAQEVTQVSVDMLPAPQGRVLLTVRGDIHATNAGDTAVFDRQMLLDLGQRNVSTHTIWTEGQVTFTGVPLKAIIDRLGVTSGTIRATAVNDYAIQMPYEDIPEDAALLAMDLDGKPMSVRDKGPIWLVFPYDQDPKYRTETYHARSIWQLVALDILP